MKRIDPDSHCLNLDSLDFSDYWMLLIIIVSMPLIPLIRQIQIQTNFSATRTTIIILLNLAHATEPDF